ncbi:MAG: PEGA domain-containing protein [Deltaproteobacteria bacterium]|nr:PEGA domain-containing protein [Deltaproteobacteria bacterium]
MTILVVLVLVVLVAMPTTGAAQAPSDDGPDGQAAQQAPADQTEEMSPEDPRAAREAGERFAAGIEHFEARQYREAIHEFEIAVSLVPSADIWFNVARCYELLREFEPAIQFYRRYLRDRVDPPDRATVEEHITNLEARLEQDRQRGLQAPTTGTLRVQSNLPGATVHVDGREVGQTPLDVPMSLEPGEHDVTVENDGYIPFRSQVDIEPGTDTTAFADLREATEYQAVRGTRIITWIAAGLTAGALGTSLGFAIAAQGKNSEWQDMGSLPVDPMAPGETHPVLQDARDLALVSDVLLGVGIGLAVATVVLYFIEGRAVATERVAGQDVAVLHF